MDVATEVEAPVGAIVAMIHVKDVERSAEFYRLLGFEIGNYVPRQGTPHWAWLYQPKAADWKRGPNLMLTRTARPLNPDAQDVLFHLYAADLVGLRESLLNAAVKVGEIGYPEYLPAGEFRMTDPDGYCLMVAQSGERTP
jgi:catechol 2,3-dioxygenase-like lactoylglutathione lyase family enzyme